MNRQEQIILHLESVDQLIEPCAPSPFLKRRLREDAEKFIIETAAALPAVPSQSFNHVIYALGGTTPTNFLKSVGIAFDGNAPVVQERYETSLPGLYLIGDLSAGRKGGSINLAFNMAQEAMRNICTRTPELCED